MSGPVNYKGLAAVTVTGAGAAIQFHSPRNLHSMQVILTGTPTTAIVTLEGTNSVDGSGVPTGWTTLATWDLVGGPRVSGDLVVANSVPVTFVRNNLTTLTGGSSPTVTTECCSEGYY